MTLDEIRSQVDEMRFSEAQSALEQLLKHEPELPEAHYLLAFSMHNLGRALVVDYARVLRHYDRALELGWDEFWTLYNRGSLKLTLGRFAEARADLDRALIVSKNSRATQIVGTRAQIKQLLDVIASAGDERAGSVADTVLALSVPKCGTMLLHGVLSALLGPAAVVPNLSFDVGLLNDGYARAAQLDRRVYVGHVAYATDLAAKWAGYKKIILVRDPRDYVVSHGHFLTGVTRTGVDWSTAFTGLAQEARMSALILGLYRSASEISGVTDMFRNYALRWVDDRSLLIRYEDLVGERFGGTARRASTTIKRVAQFLDVELDGIQVEKRLAEGSDPRRSPTFRRGGSGGWQGEFSKRNVEQFHIVDDGLLDVLGYDPPWQSTDNPILPSLAISGYAFRHPRPESDITMRFRKLEALADGERHQVVLATGWVATELVNNGHFEEAAKHFIRLIALEPENARWRYLRAFSLHQLRTRLAGEDGPLGEEALRGYTEALDLGFDEYWVRYHRGQLYAQQSLTAEAIDDLRRAVELNTSALEARELLNMLLRDVLPAIGAQSTNRDDADVH